MKNIRTVGYKEYNNLVSKICRELAISDWNPDYIVGITRGGLYAAVMISHYFNVPMYALDIKLRDGDPSECESNLWMSEDAFGYDFDSELKFSEDSVCNILIVDDINDTGATVNWLINDWQSSCLPSNPRWESVWGNNVKFATVFDNTASKSNLKMDFVGEEVTKSEDDWIVFPYETWWTQR